MCGIPLMRVVSETVSVFFYIFDKSSSFSPQKIHSTKAAVSVDDLHFSSTMFFFLRTSIARTLIFHVGLVKSCFFSSLVF